MIYYKVKNNYFKLKDWFINLFLNVRLWYFINLKNKKFINVNNDIKKEGWELTFNDEFDEGKLNKKKWRTDNYFGLRYHPINITEKSEAPDVYYGNNMFVFENSIMKQKTEYNPIKIKHVDWKGVDWGDYKIKYRAGQIDSSLFFKQRYGFFEIRSKITEEPGHWPAFWLASTYSWPPEIDVYEIFTGNKKGLNIFESNLHWGDINNKKDKPIKHKVLNVSKDFNIYGLEWNRKKIKFYYNNILVRVVSDLNIIKEFKFPMHIIIGTGVDVRNGRGLENAKFPAYHEIDYVRAYKKRKE